MRYSENYIGNAFEDGMKELI